MVMRVLGIKSKIIQQNKKANLLMIKLRLI